MTEPILGRSTSRRWATVDHDGRQDHGWGLAPRTKWHLQRQDDGALPVCGSPCILNVEDSTALDEWAAPTAEERCKRCEMTR